MLEKIKNAAEAAKSVLLYVLTPILFVAGYIYYLMRQNEDLKTQLHRTEADKKMTELVDAAKAAKEKANDAEKDYERVKRAYLDSDSLGDGHGNDDSSGTPL